MLPHGWSLRICPGLSFAHFLTSDLHCLISFYMTNLVAPLICTISITTKMVMRMMTMIVVVIKYDDNYDDNYDDKNGVMTLIIGVME